MIGDPGPVLQALNTPSAAERATAMAEEGAAEHAAQTAVDAHPVPATYCYCCGGTTERWHTHGCMHRHMAAPVDPAYQLVLDFVGGLRALFGPSGPGARYDQIPPAMAARITDQMHETVRLQLADLVAS